MHQNAIMADVVCGVGTTVMAASKQASKQASAQASKQASHTHRILFAFMCRACLLIAQRKEDSCLTNNNVFHCQGDTSKCLCIGEKLTCAATAMAVMKTPSTPKGVKKVCRLRVSLKGTGSLRSNTPLHQDGNYYFHQLVSEPMQCNKAHATWPGLLVRMSVAQQE